MQGFFLQDKRLLVISQVQAAFLRGSEAYSVSASEFARTDRAVCKKQRNHQSWAALLGDLPFDELPPVQEAGALFPAVSPWAQQLVADPEECGEAEV